MGELVRLGSVCFFDLHSLSNKTDKDYEFEYISLSDVEKGVLLNTKRCQFAKAPSRARRKVRKGDVLLATVRPNLQAFYLFKEEIHDTIVSTGFCVLTPQSELLAEYLHQYLFSEQMLKVFYQFNVGSNYPAINSSDIKNFPIFLPPLPEQKAIADILQTWDTAIEKTEALIAAKEKQFDWLVSRCINQSGYKKSQLSKFTSEVSKRNEDSSIERVLSVTNHSGFVLPENQFERRVASANLSNYKIVSKGEYAYNPSRINVGSIARLDDWDTGVLSPMYIVFKLDSMKMDSDYFLHWLSSSEARQRIKNSAQGSVRETVGFSDLGAIPIALPNIETQKRIAHILNTAHQEIDTLKTLVNRYRAQKRGLMQKLLTGKWRMKV